MHEEEIINLIQRYLSGRCTLQEEKMLENWLDEDTDHRKLFYAIKDIWDIEPAQDVEVDFEEEWRRISRRLGIDLDETETNSKAVSATQEYIGITKDSSIKQILRIAAVILLIVLPIIYVADLGFNSEASSSEGESGLQEIETVRGETASLQFSDGSKITLNSMTTVRFPQVFNGSNREIYLEGEAFFRVEHDEDKPFIVHTRGVAVSVLGTEFNIDSYIEDKSVEVVVRKGKVSVKQKNPNTIGNAGNKSADDGLVGSQSEVILTGGQRTMVKEGQLPTLPENVSLKPYLAWVNGQMIFDGTPMRDVIPRLERTYNLNFEVKDSTLLSERLKASFERETPEKVLGIITFSLGIDYEMRGDTVIFKTKN